MYPESGYKVVSGTELLNGIHLLRSGEISFRAFRIYLACFSLLAIREAASRVRAKEGKNRPLIPTFRICELSRAAGAREGQVRSDLRLLKTKGLLEFGSGEIVTAKQELPGTEEISRLVRSSSRPVPIPRATLRFLVREKRRSVVLVALAYMLRGLTIKPRSGEVAGKGSVKLHWISAVAGLSERAAQYARAELIDLGWLSRDSGSTQRKLNRDGAYFRISLDFRPSRQATKSRLCGETGEGKGAPVAPLRAASPGSFAPPYKDKKTSSNEESKNQKAWTAKPPGVFEKDREKPNIRNVKPQDLWNFYRVEELYFQAIRAGIATACEATALNFLASAIHSRSAKTGDSTRIFCGIIRQKLWHHITQADEEQARRALLRFRENNPDRFRVVFMAA